jgi:hypothetical protein
VPLGFPRESIFESAQYPKARVFWAGNDLGDQIEGMEMVLYKNLPLIDLKGS